MTRSPAPLPLAADALDLAPEQVRARLRDARRRGQPAWLWPDVPVDGWRAALRDIEAAARHVLSGSGGPAVLAAEGGAPVRALGVAAYTSGTGPLLGYWLESGALDASADAAALLALHLRHGRRRMERLTAEAGRALECLGAAAVPAVLLKGVHTAHTVFPDPGTRPVADIDLLVDPAALAAAERALAAAAYVPGRTQRRPFKREWTLPGNAREPRSLELAHADDGFTIDLHASLDRNFFGVATVRPGGDAAARTREWVLSAGSGGAQPSNGARTTGGVQPADGVETAGGAGVRTRVLAQPTLALYLATHASEGLHNLTLIRLIELALVLRRDMAAAGAGAQRADRGGSGGAGAPPAWRELADAAERAGALRFAYPAMALCERFLPGTVPGAVLDRFTTAATPAQRRVLAWLTPSTAQRLDGLSLEERFMWASAPGERLRRLLHGAWPAPAGRSPSELWRIYAERAWRIARGRVVR